MSRNRQRWAVVPAAGRGQRVGGETPKQYRMLGKRSMLEWSLSRLLPLPGLRQIVVCVAPGDQLFAQQAFAQHPLLRRVSGGADREASVIAGLKALKGKAADDDIVLVHDAARPLLAEADLLRVVEAAEAGGCGAILAQPVADTLKREGLAGQVESTLDRAGLWQAQTPQAAPFGLLLEALERAAQVDNPVTDEAMALELAGVAVRLVAAEAANFKVTTSADLQLARLLLAQEVTA